MSDVAEGIGGAIEGALSGRAVEPNRGETALAGEDSDICLNCGSVAPGKFCAECGQKTHIHRTLSAIGHDLIHGVLHLDGKLWRTLPMLAFKPGKLTRRYIEGERASFVSPMAMFLFSVFAMFAVFQMIGLTTPTTLDLGDPAQMIRDQGQREVERMTQELDAMSPDDPERALRERDLARLEEFIERSVTSSVAPGSAEAGTENPPEDGSIDPAADFINGFADALANSDEGTLDVNVTGIEDLDQGLIKKWRENPGLMLYKLQANAYKFSWLLIPLSIPFVWLVFAWRRKFKAYDHAIFVTYSLAFMSLLFITVSLSTTVPAIAELGGLLMVIVPPIHLYKQLRGAYEIGRFSAFWRLMVLSFFIWIVIGLFLQALLMLGAF